MLANNLTTNDGFEMLWYAFYMKFFSVSERYYHNLESRLKEVHVNTPVQQKL
jgi:hypothetical protein